MGRRKLFHYKDIPFPLVNCLMCGIEIAHFDKDGIYLYHCDRCELRIKIEVQKEKRLKSFKKLHPELYISQDLRGRKNGKM